MTAFADLHIHSRFSRATSKALCPASLAHWARLKGLGLIGTGDLTHPGWLAELGEALTPADNGFYTLKGEKGGPYFTPTGEVSCIYKQGGRVRKIHLVVLAPDLAAAGKFSRALGRLGNVESDGRPILGLPARDVLEIALSTAPGMAVVPAHIWTPWFSLFGAKSGFDRLEDCFQDLSPHITALETGLSSDPAMNRLVPALDRYALVSSSDAHSPDKLGREATMLAGELTRPALMEALAGGPALAGTVEFFPEEGKYHLDGHADCGVVLTPAETRELGGLCPVCGKPVTVGVLHRVLELAGRETPPPGRLPDRHLIPLAEVLGQVFGVGPHSQRVAAAYQKLLGEFHSELNLLLDAPLSDIETAGGPLLRLAVGRMRAGEVTARGGYDGQFGVIEAVSAADREAGYGQGLLFDLAPRRRGRAAAPRRTPLPMAPPRPEAKPFALAPGDQLLDDLTAEQRQAVTYQGGDLAVLAGPGSGKTKTLVRRAAYLLREGLVAPGGLLLTTYTRQAARELESRLRAALPFRPESGAVTVATLHALAYGFWKERRPGWDVAEENFLADLAKKAAKKGGLRPAEFSRLLTLEKNGGDAALPPGYGLARDYYQGGLAAARRWDFDDLIALGPGPRFQAVLADEFQDFTPAQAGFLQSLVAEGGSLTVFGDPNQSVYGFRGAAADGFDRLAGQRPGLATVALTANFRSARHIVQGAGAIIRSAPQRPARAETGPKITRATLATPRREAEYVASRAKAHLGVLSLGQAGTAGQDEGLMPGLALSDVAVLFRLRALGEMAAEALSAAGLPWQMCGEDPLTAADGLDFTADKISLLTMHAAKGLEFRLVFVIGAEEGLAPFLKPGEARDKGRLAEERRLFYVAATRAKDRLYLTRAAKRSLYGAALPGHPSPFWLALPAGLCADVAPKAPRRPKPLPTLFD